MIMYILELGLGFKFGVLAGAEWQGNKGIQQEQRPDSDTIPYHIPY